MRHTLLTYTKSVLAFAAAAVLLAGCDNEKDTFGGTELPEGVIRFIPTVSDCGKSGVRSVLSQGGIRQDFLLVSGDGSISLPMSCIETGIIPSRTRGELVNEDGSSKSLNEFAELVDMFMVTAWDIASGDTAKCIPDHYMEGFTTTDVKYQKVMYRTRDVAGNELATPYWMTMQPMPSSITVVSSDQPADDEYIWKKSEEEKIFYAYTNLPASDASVTLTSKGAGQVLNYTVPANASDQTDILMGYYKGDGTTGTGDDAKRTGTAGIHFYHPLTAVTFKAGTIDGIKSINDISISGIYGSGKATMNATTVGNAEADPDNRKVEEAFTWSDCSGSITLSQSVSTSGAPASGAELGEAFLLIPQQFDDKSTARISVTLTLDDGSSCTLYSPLISTEWLAGHSYCYTIGYTEGNVSVTTEGGFTPASVTNVAVSNTGDISGYVRVLVIANWVNASGDIVQSINLESEGTFTEMATSDKWVKHTDGYYYYKKGLSPGSTTTPLFGSYTPTAAPSAGLSLDMRVISQGVKYTEDAALAKSAWGTGIPVATGSGSLE